MLLHSQSRFLKIFGWIIVALFAFSLTNCGAAQPVEETVNEAQNQANYAIQGTIELGNNVVKIVNEQGIEPYLSNNPVDEQAAIYEYLPANSNETFLPDFSDRYANYRLLSFEQDTNGNFTLSLESLSVE